MGFGSFGKIAKLTGKAASGRLPGASGSGGSSSGKGGALPPQQQQGPSQAFGDTGKGAAYQGAIQKKERKKQEYLQNTGKGGAVPRQPSGGRARTSIVRQRPILEPTGNAGSQFSGKGGARR